MPASKIFLEKRLTPANAGTTVQDAALTQPSVAHPRECGDDTNHTYITSTGIGSPPRMRGRQHVMIDIYSERRLTPANAGTTTMQSNDGDNDKAHPRECGDDSASGIFLKHRIGSPPRMRGRPAGRARLAHVCRLTPANAGTTVPTPGLQDHMGAHPRECGDDLLAVVNISRQIGSPPRMRGRPRPIRPRTARPRLTPANAGTTKPTRPRGIC